MDEQVLSDLETSTAKSVSFYNGSEKNLILGNLKNSLVDGEKYFGSFSWPSGAVYSGEFCDGRRNGCGKQTWPEGSSYEGQFFNDMRHGYGIQTCSSGEVYKM